MGKKISLLLISFVYIVTLFGALTSVSQPVQAANAADWRAGRIIDDPIFTDKNAMNVAQIQTFLNTKVGTGGYASKPGLCDYYGDRTAEPFSSENRAIYASNRGNPAPNGYQFFTCLKDYYEVPKIQPGPGEPASNYGNVPIPNGARSAAQLIWDAAQRYNISPKVLLVKIQTESAGPLTTDDWPMKSQYSFAMGAHCPDSGPGGSANCDPNYAGFSIQISEAAALMRWYLDTMTQPWAPTWFKKPYQVNDILWQVPQRGCGSGPVYIESMATAALYIYTPYQPNQAALSDMYGTGDYCSAYGNRNFWRVFVDWFGSTTAVNGNITLSKGLTLTPSSTTIYANDTVTASFEIKNSASYDDYVGGVGVCARLNGQNYDLGFTHHQYIPANGTVTITKSRRFDTSGVLSLFICSYHPVLGWASAYYPYDTSSTLARQITVPVKDNPLIVSGMSLSPSNPTAGQPVTVSMNIKNFSASSVWLGSMVIGVRSPYGDNVDYPIVNDVIIPAGGTYTYSKTKTFGATGTYNLFIANWNGVWKTHYPKSVDGSIVRQTTMQLRDNPLLVAGISVSPSNPAAGQPVTASMTIQNFATTPINIGSMVIAGRSSSGANMDFGIVNDVVVPASGTYTYSKTRTFPADNYNLFIANWNGVWTTAFPKSADGSIVRQLNLPVN